MHTMINQARNEEVSNEVYEGSAVAVEHDGVQTVSSSQVDYKVVTRGVGYVGGSFGISGDDTDSPVGSRDNKTATRVLESV